MSVKRLFYTATTIMAIVGVLAGFVFLGNVLAYGKTIYTQLGVFSQVLSYINDNYVDEVEGEQLIDGAITGMLEELDPHSNYLDPDRFKKMQERNRGNYHGIGISFDVVEGNLTVISPIEGSPSHKLGIRSGDIIAEIEGKSAKDITRDDVYDLLRGPKGSTVNVGIKREGVADILSFDIVRDEIPIFSVPYHFMIRDKVGYVRMTRFSATTSQELKEAVADLERQGMEQLVLDLRGNSGGYLNEAIEVADMFLPSGRKIVYTRGRLPDSSEDYYSTGRGRHTEPPLLVMVDGGSASASEIVSGAIQDWDRGLVVGETTFGKGLVQRQYRLKNGAALLLTVARYYTPSGRLIQRDYSDRESYLRHEIAEGGSSPLDEDPGDGREFSATDSTAQYRTAGNRIVFGGGGITPDVNIEGNYPTSEVNTALANERIYFDYASHYVATHKMEPSEDFGTFLRNFDIEGTEWNAFTRFLGSREVEYDADSLAVHADQVKRSLKSEIARNLWGENARYHVLIEADPVLQEAIRLLPEAQLMARRVSGSDFVEPGPLTGEDGDQR